MDAIDQNALHQALDRLWAQFLPQLEERVGILERAVAASAASQLSGSQREAASDAAHKLAGVLGTFGLTRGTVLARELEHLFAGQDGPEPGLASRLNTISAELRDLVATRK